MDDYQGYEEEIEMKDLLFHLFYRWRSILLGAMIICILAGGYAFFCNGVYQEERETNIREITGEMEDAEQEAPAEETEHKELSPVKYMIMGFAGGVVIMALFWGIGYVLSDKIRGERELRERYGYYLLGTIPQKNNKILSGVDRLLARLEGTAGQVTEEEAYRMITINIRNLLKDRKNILVTGTVEKAKLDQFVDRIEPELKDVDIKKGESMGRKADTLEKLAACDAVILLEERDKSLRAQIQKEQESIAVLGKTVIGYVLIE